MGIFNLDDVIEGFTGKHISEYKTKEEIIDDLINVKRKKVDISKFYKNDKSKNKQNKSRDTTKTGRITKIYKQILSLAYTGAYREHIQIFLGMTPSEFISKERYLIQKRFGIKGDRDIYDIVRLGIGKELVHDSILKYDILKYKGADPPKELLDLFVDDNVPLLMRKNIKTSFRRIMFTGDGKIITDKCKHYLDQIREKKYNKKNGYFYNEYHKVVNNHSTDFKMMFRIAGFDPKEHKRMQKSSSGGFDKYYNNVYERFVNMGIIDREGKRLKLADKVKNNTLFGDIVFKYDGFVEETKKTNNVVKPVKPVKPVEPVEPVKPVEPVEPVEQKTRSYKTRTSPNIYTSLKPKVNSKVVNYKNNKFRPHSIKLRPSGSVIYVKFNINIIDDPNCSIPDFMAYDFEKFIENNNLRNIRLDNSTYRKDMFAIADDIKDKVNRKLSKKR